MTDVSFALLLAVSIFSVFLIWKKAAVTARELPPGGILPEGSFGTFESCPPEFAEKIFSKQDAAFVEAVKCPELWALFQAERKSLALLWVQQTSLAIQRAMRQHAELSRRSEDLHFLTEVSLFLRYVELRFICVLLIVCIDLAGPLWLRSIALYAHQIGQKIEKKQDAFVAATLVDAELRTSGITRTSSE